MKPLVTFPVWIDIESRKISGIAKNTVSHRPPGRMSRYGTSLDLSLPTRYPETTGSKMD